jgi:hypothetical protein
MRRAMIMMGIALSLSSYVGRVRVRGASRDRDVPMRWIFSSCVRVDKTWFYSKPNQQSPIFDLRNAFVFCAADMDLL